MGRYTKINHAHIFGMRCSGTNHLEKTLKNNTLGLEIGNAVGWKHDGLWSPAGLVSDDNTSIYYYPRPTPDILPESLMIVIYRNPIAWLRSLNLSPHHAPKSVGMSFSSFIRSPFESFYTPPGKDFSKDEKERLSFIRSDRLQHYYPNPFTMRYSDASMFESIKHHAPNVCYINLETLVKKPEEVLRAISKHYGLKINKKIITNKEQKHSSASYVGRKYPLIRPKDFAHVLRRLNYLQEQKMGYRFRPIKALPSLVNIRSFPNLLFNSEHIIRMYSYERGPNNVQIG